MASLMTLSRVSASLSSATGVRGLATGTVKWFNVSKGFGFITPDDKAQPDIFVHQSVIQCNGFRYLREEERVQYDAEKTDKGVQASNVRDLDGKAFVRPERAPGAGGMGGGMGGGERRTGGGGGGSSRGPRGPRREQ